MTLSTSILKAAACGLLLTPAPRVSIGRYANAGRNEPKRTRYSQWGDDDDHTLLSMRALGLDWQSIADAMGRSRESCRQRHIRLTECPGTARKKKGLAHVTGK